MNFIIMDFIDLSIILHQFSMSNRFNAILPTNEYTKQYICITNKITELSNIWDAS